MTLVLLCKVREFQMFFFSLYNYCFFAAAAGSAAVAAFVDVKPMHDAQKGFKYYPNWSSLYILTSKNPVAADLKCNQNSIIQSLNF